MRPEPMGSNENSNAGEHSNKMHVDKGSIFESKKVGEAVEGKRVAEDQASQTGPLDLPVPFGRSWNSGHRPGHFARRAQSHR